MLVLNSFSAVIHEMITDNYCRSFSLLCIFTVFFGLLKKIDVRLGLGLFHAVTASIELQFCCFY